MDDHELIGPLRQWAHEQETLAALALVESERLRELADEHELRATVVFDFLAAMVEAEDESECDRIANRAAVYLLQQERELAL